MRTRPLALIAITGLASAASAQQFTLGAGQLEFRIIADHLTVSPGDNLVMLALQTRYVGGDVRVASLGATRGRIASLERDVDGTLRRAGVRGAPYGNIDFGLVARQGVTEGHRELFSGGSANNYAPQNGGNPNTPDAQNPLNGGGAGSPRRRADAVNPPP